MEYFKGRLEIQEPNSPQGCCHKPLSATGSSVSPISLACHTIHLKNLRNHALKILLLICVVPNPRQSCGNQHIPFAWTSKPLSLSSVWKFYIVFFRRNHLHLCNTELWNVAMETMTVEKKRRFGNLVSVFDFSNTIVPLSKLGCAIWWTVCGNFLNLQIEFCKTWSTKSQHSKGAQIPLLFTVPRDIGCQHITYCKQTNSSSHLILRTLKERYRG